MTSSLKSTAVKFEGGGGEEAVLLVGSFLHGGPIEVFLIPVCCSTKAVVCDILSGILHIKEPLLLIGKSNPCGGCGFPLSLSEWSFTIYLTPYNRK